MTSTTTSQPTFNTKSPTIRRILKESQELSSNPSPDYHAAPLDSNLFEWHFTLRGPPAPSPFATGSYHGRIVLPPTYPLRPPSFRFLTPSGRFEVNREICLSISGFHEETWQPAWGVRTALVALRTFMTEDAKGQVGGIESSEAVRKRLAAESGAFRCSGCGGKSNAEILREQEGAAKEMEGTKVEETVPEELRMGYREDIEGKSGGKPDEKEEKEAGDDAAGIAAIAGAGLSGQGGAILDGKTETGTETETEPAPTLPPAPQPQHATVATTASAPVSQVQQRQQQYATPAQPTRVATVQAPRQPAAEVTSSSWIDLAIIGIAVMLGVMILKNVLRYLDG